MNLKKGQKFECPCGETWEDPIEDYVIPNTTGLKSMGDEDEQCPGCDRHYEVMANRDGTFTVTEVEEA